MDCSLLDRMPPSSALAKTMLPRQKLATVLNSVKMIIIEISLDCLIVFTFLQAKQIFY